MNHREPSKGMAKKFKARSRKLEKKNIDKGRGGECKNKKGKKRGGEGSHIKSVNSANSIAAEEEKG